jgi:hypothetical protein
MTTALSDFYSEKQEPVKGCLLALRHIILAQNPQVTAVWKYGMPFFCYRDKMFCYLWVHKKHKQPYLGLVEGTRLHHPELIIEKRARMKIMLFDPVQDLPIETINDVLQQALTLYQ